MEKPATLEEINGLITANNATLIETIQNSLTQSINEVRVAANNNKAAIQELRTGFEEVKKAVDPAALREQITEAISANMARPASSVTGSDIDRWSTQETSDSRAYLFSRRSLRLWPIKGENEDEIWQSVGDFLHSKLELEETECSQESIEKIRRLKSGRRNRSNSEVLVTFYEQQVRDLVARRSSCLADYIDSDGQPTAGIKIDVPQFLLGTFNLLQSHGFKQSNDTGTNFGGT
jgi:hypothetical protein